MNAHSGVKQDTAIVLAVQKHRHPILDTVFVHTSFLVSEDFYLVGLTAGLPY